MYIFLKLNKIIYYYYYLLLLKTKSFIDNKANYKILFTINFT